MYTYAAYNAAPRDLAANEGLEEQWYEILRAEELIGGLELSFVSTLHPRGVERLRALLSPEWSNVVTGIPETLAKVAADPGYGLASTDERGRLEAIADAQKLHREVRELQRLGGSAAVRAVELHSAPVAAPGGSSAELFSDSLTTIASWDWNDIQLTVEHVDTLVADHSPAKGFLTIEEEYSSVVAASSRSGRIIRQHVNWGRSAIEVRSARGPVDHLAYLAQRDILCGLIFAGASDQATAISRPWQDAHLPANKVEPKSLLTTQAMRECMALLDGVDVVIFGVKVGAGAARDSITDRLRPGLETLHAVDEVWTSVYSDRY
jgi:hypothetical protein